MFNINGKKWSSLKTADIEEALSTVEESFFFEFKSDNVKNKVLAKEVAAFANSYGGYIFLGVGDNKEIEGCEGWNEEKITSVIYDSITPTPSFDVKSFIIRNKQVLLVRIDEGSEPPYITIDGNIFERVSSSSRLVSSSEKLTQLFNKRITELERMEKKISIPCIDENVINVFGYFDIGFSVAARDRDLFYERFNSVDVRKMINKIANNPHGASVSKTEESIIISFKLSMTKVHGIARGLPSHANHFIEIMKDGSVRLRCLLIRYGEKGVAVDMNTTKIVLNMFKEAYATIFSGQLKDNLVYARKYEKLIVKTQFAPFLFSEKDDIKAYITEKHHFFCYEKKWIDDHSLDCLERKNKHYKDEGGNSFIDGLMAEIRALPKQPPHN